MLITRKNKRRKKTMRIQKTKKIKKMKIKKKMKTARMRTPLNRHVYFLVEKRRKLLLSWIDNMHDVLP